MGRRRFIKINEDNSKIIANIFITEGKIAIFKTQKFYFSIGKNDTCCVPI